MKFSSFGISAICLIVSLAGNAPVCGQYHEEATVLESINVFNEILAIPANGIPASLFRDAHAVAIIPGVIKGSFVIGARHGNGVLLVRDERGGWHAPVFITLTGGNIGWQVGVQSTDVILVFKTQQSVNGLLAGKFTLGADAAVAAGPVGRQAAAATDDRLAAEIISWSRSRGLFVGVSLDGSVIQMDTTSNANYYRAATPGGPAIVPDSAQQLATQVLQFTGLQFPSTAAATAAATQPQPILAQHYSRTEVTHVRDELASFARELYKVLDPNWQNYLALPAEVFQGSGHPSTQLLDECLTRFETVRSDSRYAALAVYPEFQSTYGLLKHYSQELSSKSEVLELPAPPIQDTGDR